jgi:hypothetical protein
MGPLMTSNHQIGSEVPPAAAAVEPPATTSLVTTGGSADTHMGVTGNAILLLGFIAGCIDARAPDTWYELESVDAQEGTQILRNVDTGNTFRVSVVQLEGTE